MLNSHIILQKSRHGKAVFANKDFNKGDSIIEFRGKIYRRKDRSKGLHSKINHYLQIGKDLYLGPSKRIDDYINHSCNPNCGIKISDRIGLFAIKQIRKGAEITFDYSTTMDEDYWEMDCSCGSRNCRKRIRDFKYLPKKLQRKYIEMRIVPEYIIENLRIGRDK